MKVKTIVASKLVTICSISAVWASLGLLASSALAGDLSEAVITKVQQQHQQEVQTGKFQTIKISQATAVANQKASTILALNSASSSSSGAPASSPVATSGGSASKTLVSTSTSAVSASLMNYTNQISTTHIAPKAQPKPPAKAPAPVLVPPTKK